MAMTSAPEAAAGSSGNQDESSGIPMKVTPYGDRALLVELPDLDQVLAVYAELMDDPPAGVIDLVPAARTIVAQIDPARAGLKSVARAIRSVVPRPGERPAQGEVEIPVRYDGADLVEVGDLTGLGKAGVVAAHTAAQWTVAFSGFAPGFGYLIGDDERLQVPRRRTPRTRVPTGSVGLAGEFSGVYPRESPGGWQLIGHTEATVWDLERDPPALLSPGVRVRFVET